MSSKKVLTAINIICFIIFVLIQSLIFFLRIIDYSLDGSKGGINDILLYIGKYLLISLIYLIPQAFKSKKPSQAIFQKQLTKQANTY